MKKKEDENEKVGNFHATKCCSPGETKVYIVACISLPLVIERSMYADSVFSRPRWLLWGEP